MHVASSVNVAQLAGLKHIILWRPYKLVWGFGAIMHFCVVEAAIPIGCEGALRPFAV